MTYIDKQQATAAHWESLWRIFVVRSGKKGDEMGGCRRDTWSWQEAIERNLQETFFLEVQESSSRRLEGRGVMQWEP